MDAVCQCAGNGGAGQPLGPASDRVALFATQLLQAKVLRWPARRKVVAGAVLWVGGLIVLPGTASMGTYVAAFGVLGAGAGFMIGRSHFSRQCCAA